MSLLVTTGDGLIRHDHRTQCAFAYAEIRSRPLARRLARIARPARVRIRARKPCLRARRRLLGWNVRFIFELLGKVA